MSDLTSSAQELQDAMDRYGPPQELDLEQALLGVCSMDCDSFKLARKLGVNKHTFYRTWHGSFWALLDRLSRKRLPFELLAVCAEARNAGLDNGQTALAGFLLTGQERVASFSGIECIVEVLLKTQAAREALHHTMRLGAALLTRQYDVVESLAGRLPDHIRKFERSAGELEVRCFEEIEAQRVTWLWPGRIPYGKLTILDGDPGLGKSLITCDLAARLSRGDFLPTGERIPDCGATLFIVAEDGAADTIRPRLTALGAEMKRVFVLNGIPDGRGNERLVSLPTDVPAIERYAAGSDVRLIIIDPVMAFLDRNLRSISDQDVRAALTPLAKMAERTGVAVLLVRHLNKQAGGRAIYRGGGSIGFTGAARSVLLVGKAPGHEGRRVLAVSKSNLAAHPESLSYRVVPALDGSVPCIEWLGTATGIDADDLVADTRPRAKGSEVDAARRFLEETLADGELPATEVNRKAEEAGIATKTLERARKDVGVVSRREGFGMGSRTLLRLPDSPYSATSAHTPPLSNLTEYDNTWRSMESDETTTTSPLNPCTAAVGCCSEEPHAEVRWEDYIP